jgi:hypothetical protein
MSSGARLSRANLDAKLKAYENRGQVLVEVWCGHSSHGRRDRSPHARERARLGDVYETAHGRLFRVWIPVSPISPFLMGLDQVKRDAGGTVRVPREMHLHFLDRPPRSDRADLLDRDVMVLCRDHGIGSIGLPLLRANADEAQRSGRKKRVGVVCGAK